MTHNLHTNVQTRSAPYIFPIRSRSSHPMLLSRLRLFCQIRSSINAAAGCVIYTAEKNTWDKFTAIFMLQICEPGMIFGLRRGGRIHWSMSVWRRFLHPDTVWAHAAWSLPRSTLPLSTSVPLLFFCILFFTVYDRTLALQGGWCSLGLHNSHVSLIPCVSY